MLKEAVGLIDVASAAIEIIDQDDYSGDRACFRETAQEAIDNLIDAIDCHDDVKKNTDAAINLLFRAVVTAENDTDAANDLVERAEKLLGFVPLKS